VSKHKGPNLIPREIRMMSTPSRYISFGLSVVVFFILGVSDAGAVDYFPLSEGNMWIYSPSAGDMDDRVDTIIGTEDLDDSGPDV